MLSILIPTYNYNIFPLVQELHEQCIQQKIVFEIIVLDDCSIKFHTENNKTNTLSNCIYQILNQNIGRSAIRNLLATKATFNNLLFLDADVRLINKQFIKNYLSFIQYNSNYEVVYGGIVYQENQPETNQLLRWIYGNEREALSEKYILAIARMDFENVKQIDVLLECYAKSILPKNDIRLIILGDGIRLEEMKILANKLNIADFVDFKGFQPNTENYYKNAFFTILTSKYEGLPTVLVESLTMNTPVISFNCETGPNEIIIDRFNGLLIENQNKTKMIDGMNELVGNEELYQSLKQNAQNSVEQFQLKAICNQWEQYLNDKL